MGAVLDKPITEKETQRVSGNDMTAGISSMQGWRLTMEVSRIFVVLLILLLQLPHPFRTAHAVLATLLL